MRHEYKAFLLEMEMNVSSNDATVIHGNNLWEIKPNGQQLARLWRSMGSCNMIFHTTTSTLLFERKDQEEIKSKFCG